MNQIKQVDGTSFVEELNTLPTIELLLKLSNEDQVEMLTSVYHLDSYDLAIVDTQLYDLIKEEQSAYRAIKSVYEQFSLSVFNCLKGEQVIHDALIASQDKLDSYYSLGDSLSVAIMIVEAKEDNK